MINIGVIGLGSMGMTHLDAYAQLPDARIVAVADQKFADPNATLGRAGNIPGQAAASFDLSHVKKYVTAAELLADPEVQAVDICAPTLAHKEIALQAIRAGKHLLVEKPLARTAADARELAAAAQAAGVVLMPAHCMRFWPGWDWLKEAIASGRYGAVRRAAFTRIGEKPGAPLYDNPAACGGAHLDLHIHDTDFVLHLFGMPRAVTSFGLPGAAGGIEHTITRYHYDGNDALITTEGGWTRTGEKRPFDMRYAVDFERASAVFDIAATPALRVYVKGSEPEAVTLSPKLGYAFEIAEFVRCAVAGKPSEIVTSTDGFNALEIIEAELRSIETGKTEQLNC